MTKITSGWLSAVASWAAENEGAVPVQASRPSGVVQLSAPASPTATPSVFVDEVCVVLSWEGPWAATEAVPGRAWQPTVSGLQDTFAEISLPSVSVRAS